MKITIEHTSKDFNGVACSSVVVRRGGELTQTPWLIDGSAAPAKSVSAAIRKAFPADEVIEIGF